MRREGFERQSIEMPKGAAPKKKDTTKVVSFFLARGNNSNPLRLFAILLEKYPIDRLAGGAFAL